MEKTGISDLTTRFKKTVNTEKINKLSLAELRALNNLLDGNATKKDYKVLTARDQSWVELNWTIKTVVLPI